MNRNLAFDCSQRAGCESISPMIKEGPCTAQRLIKTVTLSRAAPTCARVIIPPFFSATGNFWVVPVQLLLFLPSQTRQTVALLLNISRDHSGACTCP
ncbi:hypothetical protein RRG08_006746 [Elysia crispata]|uniref:Uncharacterized protein n=1 Tax=Elysia crispata TaxID=231223 RepID=A0AAE0Y6W8_9GAST|nr:hypothetical protein RRG08_006746 [Elysia crispata]